MVYTLQSKKNCKPGARILAFLFCFVFFFLQSTGEAQEVLSLRQGPVRLVRMLKTPQEGETVTIDNYCATTAVSLRLHTLGILMSHTSLPLCFTSHPR